MRCVCIIMVCVLLCLGCSKSPKDIQNLTYQSEVTNPSEDNLDIYFPPSTTRGNHFNSYDEYLGFYDGSTAVPVNFVNYEQIALLGEFLEYESEYWTNDNGELVAHYHYILRNEYDHTLMFLGYAYTLESFVESAEGVTPEDMHYIPPVDEGYRVYESEGIRYTYRANGRLRDIYWEIEGFDFGFSIFTDNGFSDYEPNPEGTFVERMLCLESAPAAVEEFAQMISTPYTPEGEVVP